MKKTLASIVVSVALFAASGVANAEQGRPVEPKWGIRPARTTSPSPLDLARWLTLRLIESAGQSIPVPLVSPADSTPTPGPAPAPVGPYETCNPERWHCPIG